MTDTYAKTASKDPDVQKDFYNYFPEWKQTGNVEQDIYNYLMNKELPVEMTDEDYVNFMIWHRGLAVPAARNLDDETVQRGHKLFREIGCATCHRPSWTTGDDNYPDPNGYFKDGDSRLPRHPSTPNYLAIFRYGSAPPGNEEQYPHGMVPYHSSLGTRTFLNLCRTQRPFA